MIGRSHDFSRRSHPTSTTSQNRRFHHDGRSLSPISSALRRARRRVPSARVGPLRAEAPVERPIDFARQIRPILSDHCFACHGPDAKQRKAKLRLDTRAGAFAELDSGDGHALVAGKPGESTLIDRTSSADPNRVMPPPKFGKKLTPEQIALLRKWIEQGANWSEHWAFAAAQRPALPKVKNLAWPRTEIDAFILARLERERLHRRPRPAS